MILSALEKRESIENPAVPLSRFWDLIGSGAATDAGVRVNGNTANQVTAYYSGVRFISETVAGLPVRLEKRVDGGRERVTADPRVDTFARLANPEMAARSLREAVTGHVVSWGNGFMEVVKDATGKIREAWPLLPDRTYRELSRGKVTYVTTIGNERVRLPADAVMHIPGFGYDGRTGYSMVALHKQALGIALAADKHAAEFFGGGMRASGFVSAPQALNPTTRQKVRESVQDQLSDAQRLLVLEGGLTFEQLGIPPGDAQFLESRKFQVLEVARILRLPPHVLYDLERATFSNIEQQSLELVIYSLMPWIQRWEEGLNKDTLQAAERRSLSWKIDARGLLRGDSAARTTYYRERFQLGSLSPNQVRELEDENRIEADAADEFYINAAMIPLSKVGEMSVAERAQLLMAASGNGRGDTTSVPAGEGPAVASPLIRDAWRRLTRGEVRELRRLKKDQTVAGYYEGPFVAFATRTLKPVAEETGEDVEALVARYAYDARTALQDLTSEQVEAVLETWEDRVDQWMS